MDTPVPIGVENVVVASIVLVVVVAEECVKTEARTVAPAPTVGKQPKQGLGNEKEGNRKDVIVFDLFMESSNFMSRRRFYPFCEATWLTTKALFCHHHHGLTPSVIVYGENGKAACAVFSLAQIGDFICLYFKYG